MAWVAPRTWVTGELLTSGTLNTHIRDNQRYLHGDDGPIILLDQLSVPSLLVNGVAVDPGVTSAPSGGGEPEVLPLVDGTLGLSVGSIPTGPPSVRILAVTPYLYPGRRYQVVGHGAVEVNDALDAGYRVSMVVGLVNDSVLSVLETVTETIGSYSAGPTPAVRTEITVITHLTVPEDAFQPYLRLYAHKSGGTGTTFGRGLALTAFPI